MGYNDDFAPAITSILRAAAQRDVPPPGPISVTARSIERAVVSAKSADIVPVIAEVKPTSPTTPTTHDDDPVDMAKTMVENGAAAISVLTEPDHFGGSTEALERVRSTVSVPVLRKDFILTERELDRVAADLVLLIARFVDDLDRLIVAARDRGFQVIVEVHTGDELREAIDAGARIIGINNRDLGTLTVDLRTVERLAPKVPRDRLVIAESGISSKADVARMVTAGADALLIGTAIMDGDIAINTQRMTEALS